MMGGSQQALAGDIAAAIGWWRDAGVDCAFVDEPATWITAPQPQPDAQATALQEPAPHRPLTPPAPPMAKIGGDAADWPQELGLFQQWWMSEETLDSAPLASRVVPRGSTGASVMVLVEQPEAQDGDELLSGPQGSLVASMLSSMGIAPDQVYFASVLIRHTPMPDWSVLQAAGIGELTRHHVHLAAPQRLIAFGGNILPLLGHDPAQSAQSLRAFNHEGRTIPLLTAHGLDALARPNAKAAFWRRWLDWTGNEPS